MTKSPDAFRTISEVSDELDLPQHVLRFWETRFAQIKPLKRGGGRRYYRPDDVDLLRGIRHLLYDDGYTIRGVQRLMKENGNKYVIAFGRGEYPEGAVPAESAQARGQAEETVYEEQMPNIGSTQSAVTVEELTQRLPDDGKSKGLLGRLRNKNGQSSANGADGIEINDEDRRHLQATLYELLECKRLLDQVR
ncbi:MAG: MerR family transcriptional regulator [Hyphomicrobiales bacterium]|nr:MAG: MerR family transcriptional regulator [Hyphomicrobiales bacterium]